MHMTAKEVRIHLEKCDKTIWKLYIPPNIYTHYKFNYIRDQIYSQTKFVFKNMAWVQLRWAEDSSKIDV